MNTDKLQVGTRVYYTGSMFEFSFYGTITTRGGSWVDVQPDDAEARVARASFMAFNPAGRWWLASEYNEGLSVAVGRLVRTAEAHNV